MIIFSLLGTPTVSEWPEIAQCLYYQTGLPRFPLDNVQFSRLPMSNECRQFLKVKYTLSILLINFLVFKYQQNLLIYNPKKRRTARQLLEHEYLTEVSMLFHTSSKNSLIERPIRSVIDRAIRQQTENMRIIR